IEGGLLRVEASEGPRPQTKFVTAKALKLGLNPIVVINKVDKSDARPDQVHDEVFDLFVALDASEKQLDFPTLFASAKQGWANVDWSQDGGDMGPLFELILSAVPPPDMDEQGPFRMLVTALESDPYLGRILTGRITSGSVRPNMRVKAMSRDGKIIQQGRITKVLGFRGVDRVAIDAAHSGDIAAIAGFATASVADTLCDPEVVEPLSAEPVDPPTLAMVFSINDSPLAGRSGTKLVSRLIRDRLMVESEGNVAIRVSETDQSDAFEVAGRGELQLGVLIETMRREGFELSISRPRVLRRQDPETGEQLEPYEDVIVDVDDEYAGVVIEGISKRRGRLEDMRPSGGGKQRLVFVAPSRGLIGYHGEFMTETRGTGIMNRVFREYGALAGSVPRRGRGVLISTTTGTRVAYAIWKLEDRGSMFIGSGVPVYEGMIIGENSKPEDLGVNPLKGKQLTNIRATGTDEAVRLTTPRHLTLEQAIASNRPAVLDVVTDVDGIAPPAWNG
ncbi:MAG: translational GTPase TypA, partial [Proteobacteria bacterium]|nr:translational GTPase TypA [Pseudomonadota bacterium]